MRRGLLSTLPLTAWLAAALPWTAFQEGEAPSPAPGAEPPPARPQEPRYHQLADVEQVLAGWLGTGLAERLELGSTAGGRRVAAVQFGGRGTTPLAERTTVLLLGGLDGVSIAGSEAVLATTEALLASPERLPPDVTFVAVPWANSDGLARWLADGAGDGRNDRSVDGDGDGRADEDPPDDMDGDGQVLELLVEDPAGTWARAEGGRFLRRARPDDPLRYRREPEGRDDDGDGAFNEDPPGGVVLDLNFPWAWRGAREDLPAGPWPLSEPDARSLAELALARRTALVLAFQGNHGRIAAPGGVPSEDARLDLPYACDEAVYRLAAERFAEATGRPREGFATLADARGAERPGAAIDWFYAALGSLSMEVGVWGPEVQAPAEAVDARFARAEDRRLELEARDVPPMDRAWARWLDDTRGGLGFVDWQPVDLGRGRRGWLGGWERRTCWNPPADVLPRALAGVDRFVASLAAALPHVEIEVREARRDGDVCIVSARLWNRGELPTGVGPAGSAGGAGLALELETPEGTSLLAGEPRVEWGHLPGGNATEEASWIVVAPPDSVLRLVATSRWSLPIAKELRP